MIKRKINILMKTTLLALKTKKRKNYSFDVFNNNWKEPTWFRFP